MTFWVPVRRQLPREGVRVLISYESRTGHRRVIFAIHSGGEWRFLEPRDKSKLPERITHWADEPKPPSKRLRPCKSREKCPDIKRCIRLDCCCRSWPVADVPQ